MLNFPILHHPCSFMIYCYLFSVFLVPSPVDFQKPSLGWYGHFLEPCIYYIVMWLYVVKYNFIEVMGMWLHCWAIQLLPCHHRPCIQIKNITLFSWFHWIYLYSLLNLFSISSVPFARPLSLHGYSLLNSIHCISFVAYIKLLSIK